MITDEVAGHLTDLLEAYTFPGGPQANGVWIAGFFGSGKSHLLKMLARTCWARCQALTLRVRTWCAHSLTRCRSVSDSAGALERSASIPARSLLFNIDEKVDKNEKDQADALLKVFLQVFTTPPGSSAGLRTSPSSSATWRERASRRVHRSIRKCYGKPWSVGRTGRDRGTVRRAGVRRGHRGGVGGAADQSTRAATPCPSSRLPVRSPNGSISRNRNAAQLLCR